MYPTENKSAICCDERLIVCVVLQEVRNLSWRTSCCVCCVTGSAQSVVTNVLLCVLCYRKCAICSRRWRSVWSRQPTPSRACCCPRLVKINKVRDGVFKQCSCYWILLYVYIEQFVQYSVFKQCSCYWILLCVYIELFVQYSVFKQCSCYWILLYVYIEQFVQYSVFKQCSCYWILLCVYIEQFVQYSVFKQWSCYWILLCVYIEQFVQYSVFKQCSCYWILLCVYIEQFVQYSVTVCYTHFRDCYILLIR